MDGQTIHFSPYMTNLIGIRGAGKSTILEALRYALDIPIGQANRDQQYKETLVSELCGSGGKFAVKISNETGMVYTVERIYGEDPIVFRDGSELTNVRPDAIINALYFGQKDLSDIGADAFGQDLIQKFFGSTLSALHGQMDKKIDQIQSLISVIQKLGADIHQEDELLHEHAEISEKLRLYRESNIDEKLQTQIQFRKDRKFATELCKWQLRFFDDIEGRCQTYLHTSISGAQTYLSKTSRPEWASINQALDNIRPMVTQIEAAASAARKEVGILDSVCMGLTMQEKEMQEEFARIRREIHIDDLNPDDFIRLQSRIDDLTVKLDDMKQNREKYDNRLSDLFLALEELKELRHEEFQALFAEVNTLNALELSITMQLEECGDKDSFFNFLSILLSGANIQKMHIRKIVETYDDPIDVYGALMSPDVFTTDVYKILKGGNQFDRFLQRIMNNLPEFLTYQVSHMFKLLYKGRELKGHSIGQRASALIIFLINQSNADLLIIDQPEDDLDNVTIYEDVVRELVQKRDQTQFLFATHNPNIPVLGDCDQVIRCQYHDDCIDVLCGPVSDKSIRAEIVGIMEGGSDAFKLRKNAYKLWGWK